MGHGMYVQKKVRKTSVGDFLWTAIANFPDKTFSFKSDVSG